jgi:anti-sigma factor RsiW
MSGCPAFEDLSALVDGDLSGNQERQLREHLEECTSCRAQFDALTTLKRSVGRAYEGEAPSPALRRAVRAGAAKGRRQRS